MTTADQGTDWIKWQGELDQHEWPADIAGIARGLDTERGPWPWACYLFAAAGLVPLLITGVLIGLWIP